MNKGLRDNPRSMPTTDKYRENYDAIFKKKDAPATGDTPQEPCPPKQEAVSPCSGDCANCRRRHSGPVKMSEMTVVQFHRYMEEHRRRLAMAKWKDIIDAATHIERIDLTDD